MELAIITIPKKVCRSKIRVHLIILDLPRIGNRSVNAIIGIVNVDFFAATKNRGVLNRAVS